MYTSSVSDLFTWESGGTGDTSAVLTTDQQLDEEDFLMILVTQLLNQDPLEPMDDTEFISQMAQLNTLDQTIQLNENIKALQMVEASALIGREVEAMAPDGTFVEGTVTEVQFSESTPWLVIDDEVTVSIDSVIRIL